MVGTQKYTDEEAEFILREKQRGTSIHDIVKLCLKKWPRAGHQWTVNGVRYVASSYKKLPQYKKFAEETSENPYPNLLAKPKPKPKSASKVEKLDEDSDDDYVPNSPSSSPLIRKHATTSRGRQLLPSAPPLKSSKPLNLLRTSDEKKPGQEWGRNHWDEDDVFGGGLERQTSFNVGLRQHGISENNPQNPVDNAAGSESLLAHEYPGAAMEPISDPRKASGKRAGPSSRKQTDSVSKEGTIAFSNPSKFLTQPNNFNSLEEAVRAQQMSSGQPQYGYHTNGYDQSLMPDFDPDTLLQQPNPFGSLEEALKAQVLQKSRNKRVLGPEDVQMSRARQSSTPQPQEKRLRTDTSTADVNAQDLHFQVTPTSNYYAISETLQQPMTPKHAKPLLGKNLTPQSISRASTPSNIITPQTLRQTRATSYSRYPSPHTPSQANGSMVAPTPSTPVNPNFLKTGAIGTPLSSSIGRANKNLPLNSQHLTSDLDSTTQSINSPHTDKISYPIQREPRLAAAPAFKSQFSLSALTSAAFADQFMALSTKSQGPLPFPSVKSQPVKPATPTGQQPTEALHRHNREMNHDATASIDFTPDRSDSTLIQDTATEAYHHSSEIISHLVYANNLVSNQATLPSSPPRPSVEEPQFTPETSRSLSPMDYAQDLPAAGEDTPNTIDGSYDFSHLDLFNSFGSSSSSPPPMSTPLMNTNPRSAGALWDDNNEPQAYPKPRTPDVASYQYSPTHKQANQIQKQYPDQPAGNEESLWESWEEKKFKENHVDPIDEFIDFSTY